MAGQTDSDFGKVLASQTQRKRAEDDLAKSEQDKIAILDSLREHVVYHDRKMRILWANKAACESAHMKREDLMGCYCYEVWAGRRSPCEDCPVIKARETGQLQMVEKMTPDGRWWYIQGHPVRDSNGQVVGTTELTLEITERRRAEEAVRKAKDELEIKVEERTVELIEAIEKLRREIDVRKRAEKDLHETKKLLSNTLNTLQDLVLVIDKDLRIIMSNWKDHDYIAEKDREGHPYCYEVFMDRKTPCNPCHAAEVFTTGEIKQLEVTNPIDGKFRDLRVLPMFDDEGKVVAVIEHLRNITDRKRAEKAQNESEFRYHELFDRISNGVAVYRAANDGEDFIFVDFNKAGERIDNIKKEALIGKSLLEAFPNVKELGFFHALQRVWRTGKPEHRPVSFYQDGRISRWREHDIYRLPSGEIVNVYEDITERKQMERALRESQQRYQSIFENAPIGFYRTTPDGQILDANPSLIQMLGYASFKDLLAVNLKTHDCRHPEYSRRQFRERIERDGEIKGMESFWKRSDNSLVHIRENAAAIRDADGRIACYEGTVEDITDQKQAAEQIRNLSQLLIKAQEDERQMISRELHDTVAQDLSVAKMECDLASGELLNERVPEAQRIQEIAGILQKTILGVRTMAYDLRPPGLEKLGFVETIYQFCEDFTQLWGVPVDFQSAGLKNLKLDYGIQINLFRLVQEGLTNIRKHAAASRVTLKLAAAYPNIILRVEDNGRGFDVQKRELSVGHGKRMGLRSMQERVILLNGEMKLQSKPGQGTKVTIKLPFVEKKSGAQ